MFRFAVVVTVLLAGLAWPDADAGVSAPLQLHTRAYPEQVKLGETFVVELVVTHLKEQRYELKPPGDLGDFEYVDTLRSRIDGPDSSTTTFQVKLSAFALGKLTTPSFSLEVSAPQGVVELPVAGTQVEVVSSLPKDAAKTGADLYDVRPPEEVPVRTWRLLYALAGLLAAGLCAYALYRWLKRPRAAVLEPVRPALPLHLRATQALDALAKENLPAEGHFKDFYFRLSEIVRSYLGELYGFEALESTTPELLDALRARSTPGLPVQELTAFAHQSDFVRYARFPVNPDECKLALELGYRVVHATHAAASAPAAPAQPPPVHGPERLS